MRDVTLARSMSRKEWSPGNATFENFFDRLKKAWFDSWIWQATSVEHFIQIVDSYIHWYHEKRSKNSVGSLKPRE